MKIENLTDPNSKYIFSFRLSITEIVVQDKQTGKFQIWTKSNKNSIPYMIKIYDEYFRYCSEF
jgi:hypothetical protein